MTQVDEGRRRRHVCVCVCVRNSGRHWGFEIASVFVRVCLVETSCVSKLPRVDRVTARGGKDIQLCLDIIVIRCCMQGDDRNVIRVVKSSN